MLTAKPRLPLKEMILYGWLPSPLKRIFYRLKGYRIGRGAAFGLGSVVCGQDVEIGDHCRIGFLTAIRGNSIRIGAHVQIGAMSILDTPNLELGAGTKINEQVFIGGLQFPDSRFVTGRNCQIMQMTFINPCRSIVIGDDSGIGGDCLLFGHTSWLSKFEGYPVNFESIEIGNSVSIAWRVFILPGVKIGDGVVVGANSLVNQSLPSRCLAVGSPARVVAKAPYFPRRVSEDEKEAILREIMEEMEQYFLASGLGWRKCGDAITVERKGARWMWRQERAWKLAVEYKPIQPEILRNNPPPLDVFLSLKHIPDESRSELSRRGTTWIDIERKERSDEGNELCEEVAMYLRRYGVRLTRIAGEGTPPSPISRVEDGAVSSGGGITEVPASEMNNENCYDGKRND